jgi:hypothetical protein
MPRGRSPDRNPPCAARLEAAPVRINQFAGSDPNGSQPIGANAEVVVQDHVQTLSRPCPDPVQTLSRPRPGHVPDFGAAVHCTTETA